MSGICSLLLAEWRLSYSYVFGVPPLWRSVSFTRSHMLLRFKAHVFACSPPGMYSPLQASQLPGIKMVRARGPLPLKSGCAHFSFTCSVAGWLLCPSLAFSCGLPAAGHLERDGRHLTEPFTLCASAGHCPFMCFPAYLKLLDASFPAVLGLT